MEIEIMMAVFSELPDNQREIARLQKELMETFQELNNRIEGIASGIQNQKNDIIPVDIKPIQQALEKGMTELRFSIYTTTKQQSHNWRVFMESDAKKWAAYLIIAQTFLTYLYLFASRFKG